MRSILFILTLVTVLQHPEQPEYCTVDKQAPPQHQCACRRQCVKDANGNNVIVEDTACKVYCKPNRCSCPTPCDKHT